MDLYDIYEKLFPDISEEELYKLPSPIAILEQAEWGEWQHSSWIQVVYLDRDRHIHTTVIKVQDTLIRINACYHPEYGYDLIQEVTIVEPVEVQRTVIEYRKKQ